MNFYINKYNQNMQDKLRTVSRLTETERTETEPNGPKRTYENTETDFYGYRNWRTSVGTQTDQNRLQLIPKRTSRGTRKGKVGYDRNDPNKSMYVLVFMYVLVCMYVGW